MVRRRRSDLPALELAAGRRTGLSDATRTAFFILDALAPVADTELSAAADALAQALSALGSDVSVSQRVIGAP